MDQKNTYSNLGRVEELEAEVICFHKIQVVHDLIEQILAFGMFLEDNRVDENWGCDCWIRTKRFKKKQTPKPLLSLHCIHVYVPVYIF